MNARGIDVSEHNPWVNRALLAEWKVRHGLCYGFYRASIGTRTDPQGAQHRNNLLAAGYLTGPYHALHEADPMEAQALKYIALRDIRDSLPNLADIERPGLTEALVLRWLDVYDANANKPLWIYTSKVAFEQIVRVNYGRFAKYGLMVADYGPGHPTSVPWTTPNVRPFIPRPWTELAPPKYDMWQYAGDNGRLWGSGFGIDLSEYRGTEADLRRVVGQEQVPVPETDGAEITAHAKGILDALSSHHS